MPSTASNFSFVLSFLGAQNLNATISKMFMSWPRRYFKTTMPTKMLQFIALGECLGIVCNLEETFLLSEQQKVWEDADGPLLHKFLKRLCFFCARCQEWDLWAINAQYETNYNYEGLMANSFQKTSHLLVCHQPSSVSVLEESTRCFDLATREQRTQKLIENQS